MVNDRIVPGLKGQKETVVCEHNVAPGMNRFSTPAMIMLMEQAAGQAMAHLEGPGQMSVGYAVDIRHLAPSSLGAIIVAYAELTEVDRNRLSFAVEVYDGDRKIGEGTHNGVTVTVAVMDEG